MLKDDFKNLGFREEKKEKDINAAAGDKVGGAGSGSTGSDASEARGER